MDGNMPSHISSIVLESYQPTETSLQLSQRRLRHTPSGELYFTNPTYGVEYGYRPVNYLPNQVYRFNPSTGNVRVVADGFGRSNDIGLNQDASIVYVIDSGAQPGNGPLDHQGARTVYAFGV
jgi:gluconolactonase